MTVVAVSHGYPPLWNMGGEVSLHRTMVAAPGEKFCLTATKKSYTFEGIHVKNINIPDVLDINSDPKPIAKQLTSLGATVVIAQNELSLPAVRAAKIMGAISVVSIHTPPRYGRNLREGMRQADYAIYNTQTSAEEWGEPKALIIHPPISPTPLKISNKGDAYTLLSSLKNKGVQVVLDLAKLYPDRRFIIVRSPAEPTHGISDLEEQAAELSNVELLPRVPPSQVSKYLKQTRILLAPSRYETYGMSAIEAAGYGIPSIHVDTPHVREGIGTAAVLVRPLSLEDTIKGIEMIEKDYDAYSLKVRARAEFLYARQATELEEFSKFITNLKPLMHNQQRVRKKNIDYATRRFS